MNSKKCFILLFLLPFEMSGQFNYIVETLFPGITPAPVSVKWELIKGTEIQDGQELSFFEMSNPFFNLCYYPKQQGIDCGYLSLNDQEFFVKGNYPHPSWGCDLDENSFELSRFLLGGKDFIILSAINWGSGNTTRVVFCHLFDITNKYKVEYFALWSIYGSSQCFGDFNFDEKIDFLEIRYAPEAKESDFFRLTFSTLGNNGFRRIEDKYLTFKVDHQEDGFPIIILIKDKWQ